MVIQICVGSSCHLKGSFGVIQVFQKLIENYHLQEQVQLKAAFCMGHCTEGVSTMFGDEFVGNVNPENAVEVFRQHVLEPMGRADGESAKGKEIRHGSSTVYQSKLPRLL